MMKVKSHFLDSENAGEEIQIGTLFKPTGEHYQLENSTKKYSMN